MIASLIDIQVNGFAGVDFQQSRLSAIELRHAVDALAAHETRRFFATRVSRAYPPTFRDFQRFLYEEPEVA